MGIAPLFYYLSMFYLLKILIPVKIVATAYRMTVNIYFINKMFDTVMTQY